eukprot:708001-Pyramimonas_sp.AAC.1
MRSFLDSCMSGAVASDRPWAKLIGMDPLSPMGFNWPLEEESAALELRKSWACTAEEGDARRKWMRHKVSRK